MPRKPRLHVPGGLYHVILRGNAKEPIFFDDEDRRRWETLLARGLSRYRHRIHAYCWMTNHVHMAVQSSAQPVWNLVRDLASQYARSTNRKMRRSGHLFERRHRAILVQADSYLTTLVSYIHQNPARAGLVDDIAAYPWSSHWAYLGRDVPAWLTIDWVLSMFAGTRKTAMNRYSAFMQANADKHIAKQLSCGGEADDRLAGDDDFASTAVGTSHAVTVAETLNEIIERVCKDHDSNEREIASPSRKRRNAAIRAEITFAAIETGAATLATVARRFGRSESALSQSLGHWRANN